jgi:protein subunit release factor A
MSKILLEIRDHEGGDDAKLLVDEMFSAYEKKANRNGL